MTLALYLLAIGILFFSFINLKLLTSFKQTMHVFLQAIEVICDHSLDPLKKEKTVQQKTWQMLKKSMALLVKLLLIIVLTAFPFWCADQLKIVPLSVSLPFTMRVDVITLTTLLAFAFLWVKQKIKPPPPPCKQALVQYSPIERITHNLAFGSKTLQSILSSLENFFFKKKWGALSLNKPIFIISLPRSGSTVFLKALSQLPNMASNTYQDMPFMLTPQLWNKWARLFYKKTNASHERVHQDGLNVSVDSPEAFDEIWWKKEYPEHYHEDSIALGFKRKTSFKQSLETHIKKTILLRQPEAPEKAHYLSKNNANIARLPLLKQFFPEACFLLLIRNPFNQARSLHKQHLHFLELHQKEPFIKKYMSDLGHFEFGELHRPLAFQGFQELTAGYTLLDKNYWLAYWISAHKPLKTINGLTPLSYERLCKDGLDELERLAHLLKLDVSKERLKKISLEFKNPQSYALETEGFDKHLVQQAKRLHHELLHYS